MFLMKLLNKYIILLGKFSNLRSPEGDMFLWKLLDVYIILF